MFLKNAFYLPQWKPVKNDEISYLIHPLFHLIVHKILNFCLGFFGQVCKPLDKKAGVDFKRYDVPTWKTNNSDSHIPQHFKK